MKLAVIGSRTFNSYTLLKKVLDKELSVEYEMNMAINIISGGARGADSLAQEYAKENGLVCHIWYPNWKRDGKKAGLIRNDYIIINCDRVIALWDGKSRGTKHSINLAHKYQKPIKIIRV